MKTVKGKDNTRVYYKYSPITNKGVKACGGKWNPINSCWIVDNRNLDKLDEFLIDMYGHNGRDDYSKVDIIVRLESCHDQDLVFGITPILWRKYRDSSVSFGAGVSLHAVKLEDCGGSRNEPSLAIDSEDGVFIKILDYPKAILDQVPFEYKIIGEKLIEEAEDKLSTKTELFDYTTDSLISELSNRGFDVIKKEESFDVDESLLDA